MLDNQKKKKLQNRKIIVVYYNMYMKNIIVCLFFCLCAGSECPIHCQSCQAESNQCNACIKNYQLSIQAQCIHQSVIPHCEMYGLRGICVVCEPTYRLNNNQCMQMYDGCLISGSSGVCSKCLEGVYVNKFGVCDIGVINCVRLGSRDQCEGCAVGYKLSNGMCVNNDQACMQVDTETGLCLQCSSNFVMFQYRCVEASTIIQNCEVMSSSFTACVYCKAGYYIYNGTCYSENVLNVILYDGHPTFCSSNTYYNKQTQQCLPMPYLCDHFDYGLMKCVSCWSINILLDGVCRHPSLRFCVSYGDDEHKCAECQNNYYVSEEGLCQAYPAFCQQVRHGKCIRCISFFLLNGQGNCQDPNCEDFNMVTNQCDQCKFSYFKNQKGICLFKDLNCEYWDEGNNVCHQCKVDYILDAETQICKFVDPDCKVFSNQDQCLQCKFGYYMNKNTNLCMELPSFCVTADNIGNCEECIDGFALLTTYQCVPISNLSHCLLQSATNPTFCEECKGGYYAVRGECVELPLYCQKYDAKNKKCVECNDNSSLKNGHCYDSYCEVFSVEGECLGCKTNYQFGSRGQCVVEVTDPNCKEFQFGLCKKCSDRYYFNKFWKCVKVNSMCKAYNSNNGECISCYPGYVVESGNCIRESQQDTCVVKMGDICMGCMDGYFLHHQRCYQMMDGCQQMDLTLTVPTKCVQCEDRYILQQNSGFCIPTDSTENKDPNCQQVDEQQKCIQCVTRMYVDNVTGICMSVNENCRLYTVDGACTKCYDGYEVLDGTCVISKPKDPNCKVVQEDYCQECYEGYYYSADHQLCVEFDPLCRESDSKTGDCTACWGGYHLLDDKCIIEHQQPIEHCESSTMVDDERECTACSDGYTLIAGECKVQDLNCLTYSAEQQVCSQCAFGAVFDVVLGRCEYPLYGQDDNCVQYGNRVCTKCKSYYILNSFKCVSLDKNCLQYDFVALRCLKCVGKMVPKELSCVIQ